MSAQPVVVKGIIELAGFKEGPARIGFQKGVRAGARYAVEVKFQGIGPEKYSQGAVNTKHGDAGGSASGGVAAGLGGDEVRVGYEPGQENGNSNGGQIGEAISASLGSRLGDPADRGDGDDEKEPAKQQRPSRGGVLPAQVDQCRGHKDVQQHCENHEDRGDRRPQRVNQGQVEEIKLVAQIHQVRQHRVLKAVTQGDVRWHVPFVEQMKREEGHGGGGHEIRNLFHQQAFPGRARKALQRPPVEQQQQHRKGDQHGLGHETGDVEKQRGGVPHCRPALSLGVAGVADQREQSEECEQHILAFGDPHDGFHAQRMDREEGGGKQAAARRFGGARQKDIQKDGIEAVQDEIGGMIARRARAKKRAVQHQAQPRQRLPESGVSGGEGPTDIRGGQPTEN